MNTLTRRQALGLLAAAPVGAALRLGPIAPTRSVTFVLVHGAWHGGWCWKKLTPLLRAAGHSVYAPTLTGCGERAHLLSRDVGLDTHVTDINAVIEYEDLQQVVLVGHSYGGMVIAGVADASPRRVDRLIFLDAFMPENGKSVADYSRPFPPITDESWHDPSPSTPQAFGVKDEREIAWMKARLTEMPRKCMTQPARLSGERGAATNDAFIQCTKAPFFAEAAERAKRKGFRYRELLSAGHDAMVSQPEALAKVLIELA